MNWQNEDSITKSIFSELINPHLHLLTGRSIKLNKFGVEC